VKSLRRNAFSLRIARGHAVRKAGLVGIHTDQPYSDPSTRAPTKARLVRKWKVSGQAAAPGGTGIGFALVRLWIRG